MVNSRQSHFTATSFRSRSKSFHVREAPLLPKLRGYFAEFLRESSLTPLSVITLAYLCRFAVRSPCSLTPRLFSAVWDQSVYGLAASPSRLSVNRFADLPTNPAYTLGPGIPGTRRYLPYCVPPSLITRTRRYRNIHLFPIDYAFRPRLRDRLTLI